MTEYNKTERKYKEEGRAEAAPRATADAAAAPHPPCESRRDFPSGDLHFLREPERAREIPLRASAYKGPRGHLEEEEEVAEVRVVTRLGPPTQFSAFALRLGNAGRPRVAAGVFGR
jgi:hypothetical protein